MTIAVDRRTMAVCLGKRITTASASVALHPSSFGPILGCVKHDRFTSSPVLGKRVSSFQMCGCTLDTARMGALTSGAAGVRASSGVRGTMFGMTPVPTSQCLRMRCAVPRRGHRILFRMCSLGNGNLVSTRKVGNRAAVLRMNNLAANVCVLGTAYKGTDRDRGFAIGRWSARSRGGGARNSFREFYPPFTCVTAVLLPRGPRPNLFFGHGMRVVPFLVMPLRVWDFLVSSGR